MKRGVIYFVTDDKTYFLMVLLILTFICMNVIYYIWCIYTYIYIYIY
jgi:hypothetical protein